MPELIVDQAGKLYTLLFVDARGKVKGWDLRIKPCRSLTELIRKWPPDKLKSDQVYGRRVSSCHEWEVL